MMKTGAPKQWYALPRYVQNHAIQRYRETGRQESFIRLLNELRLLGRLNPDPIPYPGFHDGMSPEEFDNLILSIPFDATRILEHDLALAEQGTMAESGMFPFEKDVFCFKHMPYMDHRQHSHNYFEVTFIYKGSCTLLFGGESIDLTEGDMCIIPPLSPHNQPLEPDCLAVGIVIRKSTFESIFGELLTRSDFVSTFFRASLYEQTEANYLLLKTELTARSREILHQLVYESSCDAPYSNAVSISLLNMLLALSLRQHKDSITVYRMDQFTESHHDFPLILQYIQQNFRTVTLGVLADEFHYTESHLCRMIQKHLKQNFTALLRSIKIARAQDYLENTELKVEEIADLVGYGSVDHFSRTFRKVNGESPSRYRQHSRRI